ncbi:MAG: ABC transporter substrate-binding protein, partial [Gaiellaceae bacterium MAG52_C11]|nr:ABC transporter substrate-binding protein [Candidatus Gaiellasilicea maunaloa]
MRRVSLALLALVGALALAIPAAFAKTDAPAQTPGISARTITIGGTFPLTGPASSYAVIPAAMKAYFSYVNARRGPDGKRGIYGRQIVFKYFDDGYNPVNSVQLARKLVQEDKVFAMVGTLGTEVNQAVQPYLNSVGVPHTLVSTGASDFGKDYKKYPWTIGWQPDYVSEGRLYGLDLAKKSSAKIAILYQNDSYGKDYVAGFKSALGTAKSRQQIVGEEAFEVTSPSPASQVAKLRASGANTLVIFVTPRPTIQTYAIIRALGWKPDQIYVNSVSATDTFMTTAVRSSSAATVNGSISAAYLKDPAS